MSLKQLWNKPETNFVLFQFYFTCKSLWNKLKQICFISVLFQFYFTCKSRLTLFGLIPRRRGSPGTISVKFYLSVVSSPAYYMAQKYWENFNRLSRVHERYRQTTDDRQTTDRQTDGRRHIANVNMSSRSLKTDRPKARKLLK